MRFTGRLRAFPLLGSVAFASLGKRVFPRLDLGLQRATGGRFSLSGTVGMPLLLLTTTGRRSGEPRVSPVTYAIDGEDLLVVGSNWGQQRHPAWALNLRDRPHAVVEINGRRREVVARVLHDAERAAAWQLLLRVWPHFAAYERRATERELLVFRLSEG
ncbi:nitroreductase family deazaflavin-dependent oxidoreductase [Actinocrinis puniceicyclus]|uniref:Nitroreductase family deazaflavin-dependent oxidoreductase n=1 Tax=Actinocrinis puniceicyclus TaxID=977794 RepID=A0A8J8BDY9_9ACTN|nr:nitroreductase family deazaflavin-dependent oxidoreductase [Actinocrinis puniceicyclus]MBS2964990.1 nitroreductase family deazaflavin-dependent oxidoreductase [Actinocrinis puniceicyclus]